MAVNTLSKQAHTAPIGVFSVEHGPELQVFAAMVGEAGWEVARAWNDPDADKAERALRALAAKIRRTHPDPS